MKNIFRLILILLFCNNIYSQQIKFLIDYTAATLVSSGSTHNLFLKVYNKNGVLLENIQFTHNGGGSGINRFFRELTYDLSEFPLYFDRGHNYINNGIIQCQENPSNGYDFSYFQNNLSAAGFYPFNVYRFFDRYIINQQYNQNYPYSGLCGSSLNIFNLTISKPIIPIANSCEYIYFPKIENYYDNYLSLIETKFQYRITNQNWTDIDSNILIQEPVIGFSNTFLLKFKT